MGPFSGLTRMHESDRTAVAEARGGDSEAFRSLVERHSRYVYQVAFRMTGNGHDAEDVVQETFLRVHRQLNRFEARADFRTWLHRITVNASIDLIRSRRHREISHDPADFGETVAAPTEPAQAAPDRLMLSAEIKERIGSALADLTSL